MSAKGAAEIVFVDRRGDGHSILVKCDPDGPCAGLSFRIDVPRSEWSEGWRAVFPKVIAAAEQRGVVGWAYVDRAWVHFADGSPMTKKHVRPEQLCFELISGDFSHWPCLRHVDRLGRCKVHASAIERRQARDAERSARTAELVAEGRRLRRVADDLSDLWAQAADLIGIEPERAGRVEVGTAGAVEVDAEALRALLVAMIERQ